MRPNPRLADHAAGSPIRTAQEEFARSYCALLSALERAFDGNAKDFGAAIDRMFQLKSQVLALMQMPNEDGLTVAGPAFEYVR